MHDSRVQDDELRIAELNAIVAVVRERVLNGSSASSPSGAAGDIPAVQVPLADLMPLLHARDAAQAKIAAIGGVNPRAGGFVNRLVQAFKRLIARLLQWFVRDQVVFNRETVTALEATLGALDEQNRILQSLAAQTNERIGNHFAARVREVWDEIDRLKESHAESARTSYDRIQAELDDLKATRGDPAEEKARELWAEIDLMKASWDEAAKTNSAQVWAELDNLKATRDDAAEEKARELWAEIDNLKATRGDAAEEKARELWAEIDRIKETQEIIVDLKLRDVRSEIGAAANEADAARQTSRALEGDLEDIRKHWTEWRAAWEQKLSTNEIQFLRATADLQSAFQHRVSLIEANFREIVQAQHRDYRGELDRSGTEIQKTLWADLEKIQKTLWTDLERIQESFERLIHTELRLVRQRGAAMTSVAVAPSVAPEAPLDYPRFAARFRGSEEDIRRSLEFYRPFFSKCRNVLDIGCGRGEFLELMRDAGIAARGIDLGAESIALCREKGLSAEEADLFTWLAAQPDKEFDGIFSSQVIEHLPGARIPELIRLCASKLRKGGILAIETPNPESLAIFASHFYLDPTHTRPVPAQYVHFCMEEAGFGRIEIHRRSPAVESMPELKELPEAFRERFFGGLDYAIIGRKL